MDLSMETLMRACKGDVSKLPSFIVHDDVAWPWHTKIRPAKGKLHMRRSTFNNVVVAELPVKPGLWVRPDAQEFFLDLKPHHLQGSEDSSTYKPGENNHQTARDMAVADAAGRLPDEDDYGTEIVERSKGRAIDPEDLERIARDPEKRGVRSSTFIGVHDTERDLAVGNDD
jgi:hypothetical protein